MGMRAWDVGVGAGLIRLAAGVTILCWRPRIMRVAGAPDDGVASATFTYFGVRDVVLGVATLAATRPGADMRRMMRIHALADATDAGIVLAAHRAGRVDRARGFGGAALAAATALAGLAASFAVED